MSGFLFLLVIDWVNYEKAYWGTVNWDKMAIREQARGFRLCFTCKQRLKILT